MSLSHLLVEFRNTFLGIDKYKNIYISGVNRYTSVDIDPGPNVFQTVGSQFGTVFISKLDSLGNFKWIKNFVGAKGVQVYNMTIDSIGNVYTVGNFTDSVDFDPGPSNYFLFAPNCVGSTCSSIYLSKLDTEGNFKWAKVIGGVGVHLGRDIEVDSKGNVFVCGDVENQIDLNTDSGFFLTPSNSSRTAFINKFDSSGNYIFSKLFVSQYYSISKELDIDKEGNLYFIGETNGIADINPNLGVYNVGIIGASTYFIVKLDSIGNFLWGKQDIIGHLAVDNLQNFYTFNGGISSSFLNKYDSNANLIWVKNIGGYPDYQHLHDAITIDKANNIYITGLFRHSVDADPGPSIVNLITIGGGGYLSDCFISRLDPNGNLKWTGSFGSYSEDWGSGIVVDNSGNIISIGRCFGFFDIDPDSTVTNIIPTFDPFLPLKRSYIQKLSPCNSPTYNVVNVSSCNASFYNGITYINSGTYYQSLNNMYGCDSIITLNLNLGIKRSDLDLTFCNQYYFNGQILFNSGIYFDTLIASNGCDSIVKLNLTIKNNVNKIIDSTICEGNSVFGYNSSGSFTDTFTANNGCDSIRKLNLTVKQKKNTTINYLICSGQSYLGYSNSGSYTNLFIGTNGCDSIRVLNLIVLPKYYMDLTKKICIGETYNGHSLSGNYIDSFLSISGCDSLINLTLIVNDKPIPQLGNDTMICKGDFILLNPGNFNNYLWQNGSTSNTFLVNSGGIYTVSISNSCGISTDTLAIKELPCLWKFPNVFTPNDDNVNDIFNILNGFGVTNYELKIYNRFGQLIFQTNQVNGGWDGRFNKKNVDVGTYVWKANFKENGVLQSVKGTIVLIR